MCVQMKDEIIQTSTQYQSNVHCKLTEHAHLYNALAKGLAAKENCPASDVSTYQIPADP